MNNDQNDKFIERINEIKELYIEVKEAIILAENFDPSSEVYLSPLNELRNTLDHILRSLIYADKMDNELDEAKEHLYRAGYDAYEVLAINVGAEIIKTVERYEADVISTVFPTYYTEVRPLLIDAKLELADTRAHKRLNPISGTKSFTPYKEKISNLIKQLKICNEHIPSLLSLKEKIKNEEKKAVKKDRRKFWINILTGLIIGIITAAAGIWVYEKWLKKEKPPQENRQTTTQQNK